MDNRINSIVFNEKEHTYWYNGKSLQGITGAICKLMNKHFPDNDRVMLATMYGSDVHKEVENYFNQHEHWFNDTKLSTEGAQWVVDTLKDFCTYTREFFKNIECEVMVSDFEGTASKVDIVLRADSKVWLFDIKTTSHFDREYCSLQLSVYKELYQRCYGVNVEGMYVLATKSKRSFRILDQGKSKVQKLLDMNKAI